MRTFGDSGVGGRVTYLSAVGVALIALGACQSDEPDPDGGTKTTTDGASTVSPSDVPEDCQGMEFVAVNAGVVSPSLDILAKRLYPEPSEVGSPSAAAHTMTATLAGGGEVQFHATKRAGRWRLEVVTVCPGESFSERCAETIDFGSRTYSLVPPIPGQSEGVASPKGLGWLHGCSDTKVGPIGIYGASERSIAQAVTISVGTEVHVYKAVK